MTSDPKDTSVTIHDVDRESMKYTKNDRNNPSWAVAINHSCVQSQLKIRYAIDGDVDGFFCPGSGRRTYPQ